jgi:hypothetical protein
MTLPHAILRFFSVKQVFSIWNAILEHLKKISSEEPGFQMERTIPAL